MSHQRLLNWDHFGNDSSSGVNSGTSSPLFADERNQFSQTGPTESTKRHYVTLVLMFAVLLFERIGFCSLNNDLDQLVLWRLSYKADEVEQYVGMDVMDNLTWPLEVQVDCLRGGGQFLFPLIGAWFGECLLGVHTTAALGTLLELVGGTFLLVSVTVQSERNCTTGCETMPLGFVSLWYEVDSTSFSYMKAGLVFVTIGLALTRSNFIMLTAMQLPESRLIETGIFRWYLFTISLGEAGAIVIVNCLSLNVRAFVWPVSFVISLVLVIVARFVSEENMNCTNRTGFRKLLECFTPSKWTAQNQNLNSLYKHMVKIFLFIGMLLAFFVAFISMTVVLGEDYPMEYLSLDKLAEQLSVMAIILVFSLVLRPLLRRFTNYQDITRPFTSIGLGMVLISVSCFVCGYEWLGIASVFDPTFTSSSYYSMAFMCGLSQVLCYVNSLELIYTETPKHLKNQMLGLFLTVMGLGYLLVTAAVLLVGVQFKTTMSAAICMFIFGTVPLIILLPLVIFSREYEYRSEYQNSISMAIDGIRGFGSSIFEDSDYFEDENSCC